MGDSADLTTEQQEIIETFPEQDRGVFDKNLEIARDPLEVAVQNAINQKKQEKALKQPGNKRRDEENLSDFSDSEEGEWEDDEMGEDEQMETEPKGIMKKKDVQSLRPAEGVKFVEYDQFGLPKNDGFDYSKFISTDEARPDDAVLDVAPEILAEQLAGHHMDIDKDPKKMTEDGKSLPFLTLYRTCRLQLYDESRQRR
jgi:hypothetical protein